MPCSPSRAFDAARDVLRQNLLLVLLGDRDNATFKLKKCGAAAHWPEYAHPELARAQPELNRATAVNSAGPAKGGPDAFYRKFVKHIGVLALLECQR